MTKETIVNKVLLKQLADLARIKLTAKEEEKFLKDLRKIISYFDEIEEVDVSKTPPLTGGHSLKNVFRDDEINFSEKARSTDEAGLIIDSFPDEERGYLRTPKIF